ncbi:hypothetical protein GDO86_010088 [Hymenochirus boettgeri]|uniref:Uncharacterized protein n=1 Tax=Hymenochirus boettgeri TaxID=247094 RepID=A0A8T2JRJ2_9PIPI|nr:hypothetical protein GDO86_010088 [Hymenochirus boettgeri]
MRGRHSCVLDEWAIKHVGKPQSILRFPMAQTLSRGSVVATTNCPSSCLTSQKCQTVGWEPGSNDMYKLLFKLLCIIRLIVMKLF